MNPDPQSLSVEPLIYMLMHSGIFVTVLGAVFFAIGLLFGHATWGRYKRQTRELQGEAAAMKDEIAQLKRRVGDQSVKSGPVVSIATETIHMPPRDAEPAPQPLAAPATESAPEANDLRATFNSRPAPPAVIQPRVIESHVTAASDTPVTTTAAETPPAPARSMSALAAIITSQAHAGTEANGRSEAAAAVPPDVIPALSDLPALPAVKEVQTVEDPRLGPVFKSQPAVHDDLTALKGIAKVLEKRLHDLGIYNYAQIAAWNDAQIQEVSARLAFKDRILREGWVQQAQALMEKKTASAVVPPVAV